MAKLTLTVDDGVLLRARQYAKGRGLSLSKMVEAYLADVTKRVPSVTRDTPILRSFQGILKKADVEEHRRHLAAKYR
ncbi:MAG: DUF6364 family protein [Bryobacteraceae bacterium]|jgi:hypothetical protein